MSHSGLGEITIVVTRHFGGIKLGVGGLIKAYTQASQEGLDQLQIKIVIPVKTITIKVSYDKERILSYFFQKEECKIIDRFFD